MDHLKTSTDNFDIFYENQEFRFYFNCLLGNRVNSQRKTVRVVKYGLMQMKFFTFKLIIFLILWKQMHFCHFSELVNFCQISHFKWPHLEKLSRFRSGFRAGRSITCLFLIHFNTFFPIISKYHRRYCMLILIQPNPNFSNK